MGKRHAPLHVQYALTDLGRSAAVPLGLLRTWSADNLDTITSFAAEHTDVSPDLTGEVRSA